jgi:hypothetical protein
MEHVAKFVEEAERHFDKGAMRRSVSDLEAARWNVTAETSEETLERLQRLARRFVEEAPPKVAKKAARLAEETCETFRAQSRARDAHHARAAVYEGSIAMAGTCTYLGGGGYPVGAPDDVRPRLHRGGAEDRSVVFHP